MMDAEVPDVGGVWATHFRTALTVDGLTIDFIRTDPFDGTGVVVARVACSHAMFGDLAATLQDVWHDWVWGSTPKED
jgi:hypothetical protein